MGESAEFLRGFEALLQHVANHFHGKYFKRMGLHVDENGVLQDDLSHAHILFLGRSPFLLYHSQETVPQFDMDRRNILQSMVTGFGFDPSSLGGEDLRGSERKTVSPKALFMSKIYGYAPGKTLADLEIFDAKDFDAPAVQKNIGTYNYRFFPGPPITIAINGEKRQFRLALLILRDAPKEEKETLDLLRQWVREVKSKGFEEWLRKVADPKIASEKN